MRRRRFLASAAAAAALTPARRPAAAASPVGPLKAPPSGPLPVAFVLGPHATMIDFAGPWEVFQDVMVESRGATHDEQMPFQLFTVAETTERLQVSGGMQVVPDHAFDTAPQPRVVVIPAHKGSPKLVEWLKKVGPGADMTMSVCTGAFHLAKTGLLDGRGATTHHAFIDRFAKEFPAVSVRKGVRFVEHETIATAAGLSSGIDLALRVVERYFGRATAQRTAAYMEYDGRGWIV
jgi:transcriptional regulator GlxA family with amidase domain